MARNIPSLDGLRAISVAIVICHHATFPILYRLPGGIFKNGGLGVDIFFAISGYLITYLLLHEKERYAQISLKQFYLRRAFRIFPPFYTFLLVIAALSAMHRVSIPAYQIAISGCYLWDYVRNPDAWPWLLGHTWSLAVEEQFYLLWPLAVALLRRETALKVAVGIIAASPLIRVLTYAVMPGYRSLTGTMFHCNADYLMVGCMLALMVDLDAFPRVVAAIKTRTAFIAATVFLFFVAPYLGVRFRGPYLLTVGMTLQAIGCITVLAYSVFNPESLWGKFLNLRPIQHIGTISYSIYLWQQLFTGPFTRSPLLMLLAIFLCAELSYWLIETPARKVRDAVLSRLVPAKVHGLQ